MRPPTPEVSTLRIVIRSSRSVSAATNRRESTPAASQLEPDPIPQAPRPQNESLKGSPIANRPGLYFDQAAHRWKHVPYDVEPEEEGLRDFIEKDNHRGAQEAERRNRVHQAVEDGHLEFKHHRGDHHAVVLPDASEPGRWRVSHFDERGFNGHRTFDDRHEAVADMAKEGYHVPARGSLDRLASTETWAKGTRDAAVTQLWNAAGSREAKQAIDRWYDGSTDAHDRLMSAGISDALRRGDVPEEIVKSIGHLGTVALSALAAITPPQTAADPLAWEA